LATVRDAGAAALAIEVSSIGLEQGRTSGMHFDVALFTNLTRDHLDYHGDMASYEAAKARLFAWPGLKTAVVNLDDAAGLRLLDHIPLGVAITGYTLKDAAAQPDIDGVAILRAANLRSRHAGTEFHLTSPFGTGTAKTQLVGRFNISNALAVLGALLAKGVALRAALDAIEARAGAHAAGGRAGSADGRHRLRAHARRP
jgi:UDP-N-acetylmuramoyl-L-alanyl-D-glutamate--2,6-diaminopimelate ligase